MLLVFNKIVTFFSPQITIFIFYSWKQRYRLSGILRIKNHSWLCNIVTKMNYYSIFSGLLVLHTQTFSTISINYKYNSRGERN